MHKKKVMMNLIISTLSQVITLILGMILPKVIMLTWGSEYNGLLSSITSILGYLTLLEAGFNTATLQALYKSVGNDDRDQISSIVRTSQHFYRKTAIVYALIVSGIAFIYPLVIKSIISYWEIVTIIMLQGSVGIINFAFKASYQQLLRAEGKYYITSLISLFTTILTYAVKIIAVLCFGSVLVMQGMSIIVVLLQIGLYASYFGKHYGWINRKAERNEALLINRKYYFTQQVASLIHNSTDTFVLSVFCGLKVASVYAVYNLIYSALAQMISLMRGSTNFVLGQSFHRDKVSFERVYDAYSTVQTTIGSIMASISILLITNFIRLYTQGINDVDYIDFGAACLFSMNLILECSRGTSLASANIAGKAPSTTWRYILEAGINLGTSLILVQFLGMKGVLIGTGIAGIYRTIDSIIYTNKRVLDRTPMHEMKNVIANIVLFVLFATVGFISWNFEIGSYGKLLVMAVLVGIAVCVAYMVMLVFVNVNMAKKILQQLKGYRRNKSTQ